MLCSLQLICPVCVCSSASISTFINSICHHHRHCHHHHQHHHHHVSFCKLCFVSFIIIKIKLSLSNFIIILKKGHNIQIYIHIYIHNRISSLSPFTFCYPIGTVLFLFLHSCLYRNEHCSILFCKLNFVSVYNYFKSPFYQCTNYYYY